MRFARSRLLPLPFFAVLALSSPAQAQSDAPAGPLPELPATPPSNTPPSSAAPSTPPPPPPPLEQPPPPVEAGTATTAGEPAGFYVRRYRHGGFYLAVDGGVGYLSAWGTGPLGSASISGESQVADLALGGTIAPGLVLGGLARGWTTSGTFKGGPTITATTMYFQNGTRTTNNITLSGNARATSVELGAFLDWYPDPEKGWHVGASVGLGSVGVTDDAGTSSQSTAVAGSIFGGYQWWLGPAWSLGLAGIVSIASAGHLDESHADSDQIDTGYKLMPLAVGLETELLYY